MNKKKLDKLVKESINLTELIEKMGLSVTSPGNRSGLIKKMKKLDINFSHFSEKNHRSKRQPHYKYKNEEVFCENSPIKKTTKIKEMLYSRGIRTKVCEECNLSKWRGHSIGLELHHINMDRIDNRLENLQILCSNCHTLTHTIIREKQLKLKLKINTKIILEKSQVVCKDCGKVISQKSIRCISCSNKKKGISLRKVVRPSKKQLLKEINMISIVKIGEKYGVSDNAVRKWAKSYELSLSGCARDGGLDRAVNPVS